jgi:hypothetical protein
MRRATTAALTLGGAFLAAAPAMAQSWAEVGDAGQTPGNAQITEDAVVTLTSITGTFGGTNGVDVFAIRVVDPDTFNASIVGGATRDSRLFLFNNDGELQVWNDDFGGTTQSEITSQGVFEAGIYYLALTVIGQEPINANTDVLSTSDTWPGPDADQFRGVLSLGPWAGWTNPGLGTSGTEAFTITLVGAEFARDLSGAEDYWVPNDFADIQSAITGAVSGDTIHITPGTYLESNIDVEGKALTLCGAGMDYSVIDAQLLGRVFLANSFGAGSIVENLTMARGTNAQGGSIRTTASMTIRWSRFLENGSGPGGTDAAGALYARGGATVVVEHCEFIDGSVDQTSAFRAEDAGSTIVVSESLFRGNQSGGGFIAVAHNGASVHIKGCRFTQNDVAGSTFLYSSNSGSIVNVTNTLLDGNSNGTGAIVSAGNGGKFFATNLTVVDHTTTSLSTNNADIVVQNSIFWNITSSSGFGASAHVDRCIFPGATGTNIDADPMFMDAANGDYRLASGSPAIDAGDSRFPQLMAPNAKDLAGNARLQDVLSIADTGVADNTHVVDIGAYEGGYGLPLPPSGCLADLNNDATVNGADLAALLAGWGPCP